MNSHPLPLYTFYGEVIYGRGIGKLVGMPTANLKVLSDEKLPPNGVYVTRLKYKSCTYYGVTNIGTCPTIDSNEEISVETHILNFNSKIYGDILKVELFEKLRYVIKFKDFSSLLEQIQKDCVAVQKFFKLKITYSRVKMDAFKHQMKIDGHEVLLSNKEFDVMYMMYSNPDVAFTKEQLFEAVWHEAAIGHCHAVENTVFQIRKKCKAVSENIEFIKTVVGYGYKFYINKKL